MAVKAKRTEALVHVEEIRQKELSYYSTHNEFVALDVTPAKIVGPGTVPFDSPDIKDWKRLGWLPSGDVRCQYRVEVTESDFLVSGRCDVDGDGNYSMYQASRMKETKLITAEDIY